MPIVTNLETIRRWLEEHVCTKIELKQPNDRQNADGYQYKLVKPSAFAAFPPPKDMLPSGREAAVPYVCAYVEGGTDMLVPAERTMDITLLFATWNPGLHEEDVLYPENTDLVLDGAYQRSADGWQDVWNFVDVALEALENSEFTGDLRIEKEKGIRFGPLKEQDSIPSFYPYWYATVQLTVVAGAERTKKNYNEFL